MFSFSYSALTIAISLVWILVRFLCIRQRKCFRLTEELKLLLVYICIVVVTRFTFFPFGKVDGAIQPLLFDVARIFPLRLNFVPLVHLMDYPVFREALLNLVGNITMFIPLGIIWPYVFKELNTHTKVLAAGVGVSLAIEILQLPFYDRVSDIDDLILNSLGYAIGYLIFLIIGKTRK